VIQVVRNLKTNTVVPYNLRPEDAAECDALGMLPPEAIAVSVKESLEAFQIFLGNEVIATWGYFPSSPLGNSCSVWMLSGEAANKHKFYVARESKRLLNILLNQYPCLVVMVDVRYTRSRKWLIDFLGFKTTGYGMLSPSGVSFEYLTIKREDQ
jgi:hypothetical protein